MPLRTEKTQNSPSAEGEFNYKFYYSWEVYPLYFHYIVPTLAMSTKLFVFKYFLSTEQIVKPSDGKGYPA